MFPIKASDFWLGFCNAVRKRYMAKVREFENEKTGTQVMWNSLRVSLDF
jgi:hypothetical protein